MAVPAAVLSILVQANTGGATRGLLRFNQQLDGTEAKSNKATRALGTFAKVGIAGSAIGLGFAVKKAADFEEQLDSLGSVSGATGRQMEQFRKQAMKAGADTKFSALDAAEAQTELAKGGLKVRQIMKGGLRAALALAAAGEMELGEAAQTTANALNLFGLEGEKSMKVADALAKAANATTADVTDFAMALRQSGGVAKTAGLSFTETVLALEALANAGTRNSDAGTSLKTALIQLIKPTEKQQALASKLNLEFLDAQGNFKNLADVSTMLRDRLGGMTAAQRTATLATLAGTDGVRTLTALYDAGPSKLEKWKKGLNESGTAAEVAARKQSNLKGRLENLQGSIETIAIAVGMKLIPQLTKYAEELTNILNNTKLSGSEKVGKVAELLAEAIGKGIAAAGAAAAKAAPHIAWAFVKAFMEADAWGKLAIGGTGAFLLKKLGLGSGIGRLLGRGGGLGGGGGGGVGGILKSAKPVPVFVTNPGFGGGKGGPGGGVLDKVTKGAAASTALKLASRAVPVISAGAVIAYIAGRNDRNLPTGSGSGAGTSAKPVQDAARGRGPVAPREAFKREIGTQIAPSKGIKDEALAAAAVAAERLGKRIRAARKEINAMRAGSGADIDALATKAKRQFRNIEESIGLHTRKGRVLASQNFEAAATNIGRSMAKGKTSSDKGMSAIERLMRTHSKVGKDRLTNNLVQAANNIKRSMREGEGATKRGTQAIEALMVKALQNMGFSKAQALKVRKGQDPVSGKAIGGKQNLTGKQRGGPIDMGAPVGDTVPAMLERGEYVMNRNAVRKVGKKALDTINFGAAPRFQGGGFVRIPGDPDTTGGRDKVAAGIAQAVGSWLRRYKMQVGYAYDPGGGHQSAGHNVTGTALDVVPGPGGTWDTLEAGMKAAIAAGKSVLYGTNGVGTPYPNHGRGNHAHVEWGGSGGVGGSVPGVELAKKLKRLVVDGPESLLKANVQGAIDRTREGANEVIERANKMATATSGTAGPHGVPASLKGLGGSAAQNIALGRKMAARYGWTGAEFGALVELWTRESGWSQSAHNPSSGAHGIPQSLPASKMASAGADYMTNPATQIAWGLNYIKGRYGSPSAAVSFHDAHNWYRKGGLVEGLQKGGAAGGRAGKLRANQTAWMENIWSKVAPHFGADPASKLPFSKLSFNKDLMFPGFSLDPGAKDKATGELWWPKWLVHGKDKIPKKSRTQLFLHELAHRFQADSETTSGMLAEGGAEAFARWAMPNVLGKPAQASFGYGKDVRKVLKGKGLDWVLHGQFGQPLAGMRKGGAVRSYPLAQKGSNLGGPSAHKARALGDWESDNAVDIGVPIGTAVKALTDGKITKIAGSWDGGGGQISGIQVHFSNPNTQWFYTHLKKMNARVGQQLQTGQNFGVSGAGNSVPHLHLGRMSGNPEQALNWPIVDPTSGRGKSGADPGKSGKGGAGGPIGKLAYVGDSLGVGTLQAGLKKKLGKINLASSASGGKPSQWGIGALKGLLGGAGAAMLDMGTNDGTVSNLRPSIQAVKGMLKGRPLMMASLDPQSTDVAKKNAAIRSMADVVIPWAGQAQKFAADKVHPTGAGYAKRAEMIAAAAKKIRKKGAATELPKKLQRMLKKGPLGKAFKKALSFIRKSDSKKLRGKVLRMLAKKIKKVSGSLPKELKTQIATLTQDAALYDEFANRASSLTGDEEGAVPGVVGGKTEIEWLQAELSKLFQLRNKLVEAERIIVKRRDMIAKLLERAHKRLKDIAEDIGQRKESRRRGHKELKRLQKHPKKNRARIKDLKTFFKNMDKGEAANVRERNAIKDTIIPALRGKQSGLSTARGDVLSNLETVQGLGGPMERLKSLPAVGVMGGQIFDVQMRLRDLTAPTTSISDTSEDTSERADLLAQLLRESNLRTAVSQKQYEVFQNMPPYGGQFATGGVVPGPIGSARTIIAHGGETVVPTGGGEPIINVNVIVQDGAVDKSRIRAEVENVTRKQARASARMLPGRGGGI